MSEIDFSLRNYPLKYMVGEKTLLTRNFDLMCYFADPFRYTADDDNFITPYEFYNCEQTSGFYLASIPISNEYERVFINGSYIRYLLQEYQQYYIDLTTSYEEYLANFSSKTRSTLKRKVKKFAELSLGEIDWKTYKTPEEIKTFFTLAREVSQNTYQERLLNAGFPESDEFQADLIEKAKLGTVRGYLLFLEGKPVSYLYCPIENRKFIYSHLGYLPEMAQHSVGTVLQMLVLEDIFNNEDADYFDFTEGQSPHKSLFSTHSTRCANFMFLKNSFNHKFWINLHIIFNTVFDGLIGLLDKMGIKAKIKKMIRRVA